MNDNKNMKTKQKPLRITLLCLFLAALSCLSLTGCGPVYTSREPGSFESLFEKLSQEDTTGQPEVLKAYRSIFQEYLTKYGDFSIQGNELYGVCYAALLDFNKDGTQELLLVYNRDDHTQQCAGWTYRNTPVELEMPLFFSDNSGEYEILYIAEQNGEYFFASHEYDTITFWRLRNDCFETAATMRYDYTYSASGSPTGTVYYINEKKVSESKYYELKDSLMENGIYLCLEPGSASEMADSLAAVKKTLGIEETTAAQTTAPQTTETTTQPATTTAVTQQPLTQSKTTTANMTEAQLKEIFHRAVGTDYEIEHFFCDDYDGNGRLEAYAVVGEHDEFFTGDSYINAQLYYIDASGVSLQKTGLYGYPNEIFESNGYRFLSLEHSAGGSGSTSYVFGVRNGIPLEMNISGQYGDIGKRDGQISGYYSDFSTGVHRYIYINLALNTNSFTFYQTGN